MEVIDLPRFLQMSPHLLVASMRRYADEVPRATCKQAFRENLSEAATKWSTVNVFWSFVVGYTRTYHLRFRRGSDWTGVILFEGVALSSRCSGASMFFFLFGFQYIYAVQFGQDGAISLNPINIDACAHRSACSYGGRRTENVMRPAMAPR